LIDKLLDQVDHLLIGGGMSYTFWKAQGGEVGKSIVEEDQLELANQLIDKAKSMGNQLLLPRDTIIADLFDNDAHTDEAPSNAIPEGWMGLDIGPQARKEYANVIDSAQTLLWNGPMGVFEMEKFQNGTKAVAEAVAQVTDKGAFSLIGGGDSVSAVTKFGLHDRISFVSTGGGALLEFFEGHELPGIQAIEK
jgi:phosphoglycerate kinase